MTKLRNPSKLKFEPVGKFFCVTIAVENTNFLGSGLVIMFKITSVVHVLQVNVILESHILPAIEPDKSQRSLLQSGISESCDLIRDQLLRIQTLVTAEMVMHVSGLIKQVSDIPRLYRRTNKEVITIIIIILD